MSVLRSLSDSQGMDMPGVLHTVLQSDPDGGDCVVAALTTVLGGTYAETAILLGVALDPATGAAVSLKGRGIDVLAIGARLLRAGIASTPLPVAEDENQTGYPDIKTVRDLLAGRRALVLVLDQRNSQAEPHALAWTGARLLDCRGPSVRELDLQTASVLVALVLTQEAHP